MIDIKTKLEDFLKKQVEEKIYETAELVTFHKNLYIGYADVKIDGVKLSIVLQYDIKTDEIKTDIFNLSTGTNNFKESNSSVLTYRINELEDLVYRWILNSTGTYLMSVEKKLKMLENMSEKVIQKDMLKI